jgi:hypothetical protein
MCCDKFLQAIITITAVIPIIHPPGHIPHHLRAVVREAAAVRAVAVAAAV